MNFLGVCRSRGWAEEIRNGFEMLGNHTKMVSHVLATSVILPPPSDVFLQSIVPRMFGRTASISVSHLASRKIKVGIASDLLWSLAGQLSLFLPNPELGSLAILNILVSDLRIRSAISFTWYVYYYKVTSSKVTKFAFPIIDPGTCDFRPNRCSSRWTLPAAPGLRTTASEHSSWPRISDVTIPSDWLVGATMPESESSVSTNSQPLTPCSTSVFLALRDMQAAIFNSDHSTGGSSRRRTGQPLSDLRSSPGSGV